MRGHQLPACDSQAAFSPRRVGGSRVQPRRSMSDTRTSRPCWAGSWGVRGGNFLPLQPELNGRFHPLPPWMDSVGEQKPNRDTERSRRRGGDGAFSLEMTAISYRSLVPGAMRRFWNCYRRTVRRPAKVARYGVGTGNENGVRTSAPRAWSWEVRTSAPRWEVIGL